MSVDKRFKKIRELLKLTQDEMSRALGTTRAIVGDIERGKSFPNPLVLTNLHFKYNIDLNWLICGSGKMKHSEMSAVGEGGILEGVPDREKYIQALENNMELNREIKNLKETLEWYKTNYSNTEKKK
jgi:transcriptional regulator with XRE-family HTH domain